MDRVRRAQGIAILALVQARNVGISSRPLRPVSRPRRAFCRLSWKVRPMAMTSPTDFMAVVRVGSEPGKLLEGKTRDLGDHIVDGRLEGGRRRAAGNVVVKLVQRVADGQLGRDLGDRENRWPWTPARRSATHAGSSR